jgi:DNA (cytosine-5)-methyltransferase 1
MKIVSLFSGAGGFDLGFIQAGHQMIWANDIWHDAVETYRKNLDSFVVCKDIHTINTIDIPNSDIVIGGFPCQGFSVANTKRNTHDVRNFLYQEFIRILQAKQPPFFLAENVKGILSLDKGKVFHNIIKDFSHIGYQVKQALLNAADYGVPQTRERVFILGIRKDIACNLKFPPTPTHEKPNGATLFNQPQWVSVGEALKNIPEPNQPHNLANHEASQYKLRFNGYLGHRRIDPLKPCPTITSRGDDKGGVVVHHHPNNHRRLSAREAAIIQTFPVNFTFVGTKTSVYRQVANAVPPLLAKAIAQIFPHKGLRNDN